MATEELEYPAKDSAMPNPAASQPPALFDIVSFGETMLRLTPIGARLVDATQFAVHVAGTEANTLTGLAHLGLNVAWSSALPNNPLGLRVANELRRNGVHTDYILWAEESARLGIFYAEEMAPPIGTKVIYDRANSAIAAADPAAFDITAISNTRLLHLTGITPALGENARALFARCLARARNAGVPLSFDVNYRAKLWSPEEAAEAIEPACRQARLLFVPMADAAELWGCAGAPEEVLRQLAGRFAAKGEEKTIIVTCGSDGAAQWENGAIRHEPAFASEGTIRFGSGDAFAAGYLYAWLGGPLYQELAGEPVTPLTFGNAMAALKRCIPGDLCLVAPDELTGLVGKASARFR